MELPMRLGVGQFNELNQDRLQFIKQLGVGDVVIHTPRLPPGCQARSSGNLRTY